MPPADTRVAAAETRGVGEARSRARAHIRARDWARRRRTTRVALQGLVLVLGVSLVAAGAVMLVLPGPGWAAIVLGLLVLASEFTWAERLLDPLRKLARRASDAVRTRRDAVRCTDAAPGRVGAEGKRTSAPGRT